MTTQAASAQLAPLGRLLKRLRAQQDLTQEALAERVHCSVQTIRFFESGRRRPSWEMAELLADALHVPAAEREEFIRTARLTPQDAAEASAPLPTAATLRLPRPLTPLIGRAAECALLETLLIREQRRLVTLVGTGGIGKTRLALHIAHWLGDRFPDGAAFVSLAAVQQVAEIPPTIARALGVTLAGDSAPLEQLDALLGHQALLLVLDNFEHLLRDEGDAAVELIGQIVAHAPGVQLLITSTERLRLAAESLVELRGLVTADAAAGAEAVPAEAIMLYTERALQVAPDFALTPANHAAVARICTLLEGMPLGLELAASWARMLTAQEIAAEIERSLDFLTLAERGAPVRHRSLRAVFDHTWRLMAPEEQRVLPRLAVFHGGFTRTAALEIAGATLVQLAVLIDKSVLRVAEAKGEGGVQGVRYSLHGLLRQFLVEKLAIAGETHTMRQAHAAYFTALAEQAYPNQFGKDTAGWQQRLAVEQGNLVQALTWTLSEGNDAGLGLRLAGALSRTWRLNGEWRQGCAWLALALAPPTDDAAARARALVGMGECCHALSDYGQAERCLRKGLALWQQVGDPQWIAWALFQLGVLTASQGNTAEASATLEASLDLYRQRDDWWGVATVLNQLGAVAVSTGDYARAARHLDEAIPLMRALGQGRTGLAVSLNALGRTVLAQGETTRAIALFEEALAIFRQRNVREGMAWSHINLALAQLQTADPVAAQRELGRCLAIYEELEMVTGLTATLNALAALAAMQTRYADAARLAGAAGQLCHDYDCHLTEFELGIHTRLLVELDNALTPATAATLQCEGARFDLPRAVALGRSIANG
jgi:predicted ATPase/DNA-binding XRE family transcriptional regulator